MSHAAYPKWLYNKDGSKLVADAEAHEALGAGWFESPADVTSAPEREALIAQAEKMGIKVDKRWSDARISDEIKA
jgi:hypothetical protein